MARKKQAKDAAAPRRPTRLYTAAEVRELDRAAAKELKVPSLTLMERAGAAALQVLRVRYSGARRLAVFCGGGNNAGDGYVLARLARKKGMKVTVIALADPASLAGDAAVAARRHLRTGSVETAVSPAALAGADVIVDALLGSGLDRDVTGAYAQAVELMNESPVPVLAVDIPSGLNADTGARMGAAVKADATVTFIGMKRGLFTADGPEYCGEVLFDDLGAPAAAYARSAVAAQLLDPREAAQQLPPRPRQSHKGRHGHVLVVGGDHGFLGAAVLAGSAAVRTGAGLVTVVTRPQHAACLALHRPELMTAAATFFGDLASLLARASVVAVGPGLGQSDWAVELFAGLLESRLPLVADADALNLLAREPQRRDNWVLTPHPGEAARLLGTSSEEVQSDRFAAAAALQDKYGGVIVLKGAGSLVLDADGITHVNCSGNPGMGSGGMGDVLTGVIAGLLAQGLEPGAAARVGTHLHGRAADLCAAAGERGLSASDLLPVLRSLVNPSPCG